MAHYHRSHGFSATELIRFLHEVDPDKISVLPPVWPVGGEVYVYRDDNSTDWRYDGYVWKWDGQKPIVSKNMGISFIRYDAVVKSVDKMVHRDFKRMGYRGHGYVVVVYRGDNTLAMRSNKVAGECPQSVKREMVVTEKNSASYIKAVLNVLSEMKQQTIITKRASAIPDEDIIKALSNWPTDLAGNEDPLDGADITDPGYLIPQETPADDDYTAANRERIVLQNVTDSQLSQIISSGLGLVKRHPRRGAFNRKRHGVSDDDDEEVTQGGKADDDFSPFPAKKFRTGSGRVSKPPKHLVSDYIRVAKGINKPGRRPLYRNTGPSTGQHRPWPPVVNRRAKLAQAIYSASDEDFIDLALPRLAKMVSIWEYLLVRSESGEPPMPSVHEIVMDLLELNDTASCFLAEQLTPQEEDESVTKEKKEVGKEEDEVEEGYGEVVRVETEKQSAVLGLPIGNYKQQEGKVAENFLPARYRNANLDEDVDFIKQPSIKLVDLMQSIPTEQEVVIGRGVVGATDSSSNPKMQHMVTDEDLSSGRFLEVLGQDGELASLVMEASTGNMFDRVTGQQVSLVDDNGQPINSTIIEAPITEGVPVPVVEEQALAVGASDQFVNIEDVYPGVQITPITNSIYRVVRPDGAQYEIESLGMHGLTLDEVRAVMDT